MTKEYRTGEQFEEICESVINGNWKQAANECIEYGFYAADLVEKFKEGYSGLEATDLAFLTERAAEERYK